MSALYRLIQLLYFMLPAYAANMAPPFLKYWNGWNPPIARQSLGSHKTVLGFASGVCAAVLVVFIQSVVPWDGRLVAYEGWLGLGLRFGVGAMAGDSLKSFVKRRVGVAPGEPWIPFDQVDFAIGALVLTLGRAALSWLDWTVILVFSVGAHVVVTRFAYSLKIRDAKW